MRASLRTLSWIALTLLLSGADCTEVESARRRTAGNSGTEEGAARVAARIAGLTDRMGGAIPNADGTDATLAERMAFHDVPGVAVAVVHRGRIEWVEGFGLRAEQDPTPLCAYCFFQGASLSKVITAVAALRAVEEGLLALDSPVNASLVSWQIPDNAFTATEPVTLRRLLSHTGGLNVPSFPGYVSAVGLPTPLEILDGLGASANAPIRVFQTPGSDWSYSGGGYVVIQQALDDVTGSYGGWVRDEVFEPARMWASGFLQPVPPGFMAYAAVGNVGADLAEPRIHPELAAAGVWTNVLDLAHLVLALQRSLAGEGGAVLAPATAQQMFTPQTPGPSLFDIGLDPDPGIGLGIFLTEASAAGGPSWFWHIGVNLGYTSLVAGALDRQEGIAIMTNGQSFFGGGRVLAWEIIDAVARTYGWESWGGWGH